MSKLFIGGLAWATETDKLRSVFSSYGNVTDAIVMRDRETGRSRGFGFVTFASDEEAEAAIRGMNDQEVDGRRIKVDRASSREGGASAGGFPWRPRSPGGFRNESGSSSVAKAAVVSVVAIVIKVHAMAHIPSLPRPVLSIPFPST